MFSNLFSIFSGISMTSFKNGIPALISVLNIFRVKVTVKVVTSRTKKTLIECRTECQRSRRNRHLQLTWCEESFLILPVLQQVAAWKTEIDFLLSSFISIFSVPFADIVLQFGAFHLLIPNVFFTQKKNSKTCSFSAHYMSLLTVLI